MNPRTPLQDRQGLACSFGPLLGLKPGKAFLFFVFVNNLLGCVAIGCRQGGKGGFSQMSECAEPGLKRAVSPFPLGLNRVDSLRRKTLIRGYAVCVNHPFFLRPLPRLPLQAVSAMTPMHRPITPLCAPLVGPQQVPLSPMQPVAAKPKAHLLARWSAVCHVAFRACQPATDSGLTTNKLTGPRNSAAAYSTGPFGVFPQAAFLHFRALGALPRKGCHV